MIAFTSKSYCQCAKVLPQLAEELVFLKKETPQAIEEFSELV